jgi:hypothetical protein
LIKIETETGKKSGETGENPVKLEKNVKVEKTPVKMENFFVWICCHNERESAACLAEERHPRVCPLARLLRACGLLQMEIKLPACLILGVAGHQLERPSDAPASESSSS